MRIIDRVALRANKATYKPKAQPKTREAPDNTLTPEERNALVLGVTKMCWKQAHRWAKAFRPEVRADVAEQLYSAAVLGAVWAARKFDPTKGAAFPTFCMWQIRSRIQQHLQQQTPLGYRTVRGKAPPVLYIYAPTNGWEGAENGPDMGGMDADFDEDHTIASRMGMSAFADGERWEEADWEWLMGELPKRWRRIVALYYREGKTLAGVGKVMRITRERVRQLLVKSREIMAERIGELTGRAA